MLRAYRSAVEEGRDAIMLTHRRKDVDALNRRSHAYAAEHGQLEGPAITVGSLHARGDGSFVEPKEFRAGDLAVCLENDHQRGLTNGMRVQVIGVDPELHTVTLRTPDDRQVAVDVRHYDAIDHGYAMTVHKAQGLSVDVSLVLARGTEGQEWTYTAMSRGREANRYYTNSAPPLRDERGTHLHEERPDELAERLERQWGRSEAHDSTLDYERFDEAVERRRLERERELSDVLGRLEDRTPRRVPAMSIDDDPFDHDEAIDHDPFQYSEGLSPDIGGPGPF